MSLLKLNHDRSCWASELCDDKITDDVLKTVVYTEMQNSLDFAYLAEYDDELLICFRGTDPNNIRVWLSNIDPYPLRGSKAISCALHDTREFDVDGLTALRANKVVRDGPWGKGTIHDGFYTAWSFFKPEIKKYLEHVDPKKRITVTGRSRGGALAELCARDLKKNRGRDCTCYTYAAPAVGVQEYAEEYRKLGILLHRVTVNADIVPELPPASLGFRHVGNHIHLTTTIWWRWHKLFLSMRIKDHLGSTYDTALRRHA
jgi:predicted lipase